MDVLWNTWNRHKAENARSTLRASGCSTTTARTSLQLIGQCNSPYHREAASGTYNGGKGSELGETGRGSSSSIGSTWTLTGESNRTTSLPIINMGGPCNSLGMCMVQLPELIITKQIGPDGLFVCKCIVTKAPFFNYVWVDVLRHVRSGSDPCGLSKGGQSRSTNQQAHCWLAKSDRLTSVSHAWPLSCSLTITLPCPRVSSWFEVHATLQKCLPDLHSAAIPEGPLCVKSLRACNIMDTTGGGVNDRPSSKAIWDPICWSWQLP